MEVAMQKKSTTIPDLSMYHFTRIFISLEYPLHLLSPLKRDDKDRKKSEFSLIELGGVLGMDIQDNAVKSAFNRQQSRLNTYKRLSIGFSSTVYVLIGVFISLIFICLVSFLGISDFISNNISIVLYPYFIMSGYVGYKSANRMVSAVLDRHYADMLSFVTCLYLFANLARENVLAQSRDRKQLLARIRALRQYLILLPHQFSASDLPPSGLVLTQFRCMAEFTEDKENQIIVPCANSQNDLFVEFHALLEILLSMNYGEFRYKSPTEATLPPSKDSNRVFIGVLKFLGSVFPLALLLLVYFFPEQIHFLGIDSKVIVLVSMAWLLLAIDANLKLGIVERVSSLAKVFKDLS